VSATSFPFRSDTSHIFREAAGHFPIDTPGNRAVIQSAVEPEFLVASKPLGPDGVNGVLDIYQRTLADNTQAWAEVRNGVITNGGLNVPPWVR
jgi:hypothetical protein